ncbi:putative electron transfer flavo protein beta chain [Violaceomyces palustris]|uniref:Electron transfer flavo protein beta chain n=1 Tax=Violaceomyces palustris TaxID=1673888 RepID=A0ACD0NW87_9BASI|nr:putative electron transfer flavo protein beta chain [Violaceomyces palustris]
MRPSLVNQIRVLVPIKRTIDYAVKVRPAKDGKSIETAGVKMSMNPFDEIAVEEAVRLREKYKEAITKITVVSVGPPKSADVIRTALAMGADDGIIVEVPEKTFADPLEPLGISKILQEVVKKAAEEEEVDLIIMGKQAIDDDASQTGQMLAGLLNWPQATYASKLEFLDDKPTKGSVAQVTREIDGGLGIVKTKLPFILTTDLRLNEPRYASLPNIMKAKKKPMKKYTLKDLGLEEGAKPRLETLKVEEPPKRQGGAKVADVDELISKLQEAGRI